LLYGCRLPNVDIMWTMHNSTKAKLWLSHYIGRMQRFVHMLGSNTTYVNLTDD